MVKLKSELINQKEIEAGKEYVIVSATEFKSDDNKGVKLLLKSPDEKDKQEYFATLWIQAQVGLNSKLGAFAATFGEFNDEGEFTANMDTDTWLNRKIFVENWVEKKRKIRAID